MTTNKSATIPTIISIVAINTVNLWLLSKSGKGFASSNPLRILSQISALLGFVFMSLSLVLTTRLKVIEKSLGGLDQVFDLHHRIGIFAFMFSLTHPFLLIVQSLPSFALASIYIVPGTTLSYNLGIFGTAIFLYSFLFLLFIKIPYPPWLNFHRLLALSFLLIGSHSLLIGSDMANYLPLKIWIFSFLVIGLVSAVYKIFLYRFIGPKSQYRVVDIKRLVDVIEFYLDPVKRPLAYQPAQFVFANFQSQSLPKESHPFTISSATTDDHLRLSVKILGDFTLKLPQVKVGDPVTLYGPYGGFSQSYLDDQIKNFVWIGGGIGITPFLSLLHHQSHHQLDKNIVMVYSYSRDEDAIYLPELSALSASTPGVTLIPWNTRVNGRLTAAKLLTHVAELEKYYFNICGPLAMMVSLKKQLTLLDVPSDNIYFENFQLI